MTEGNKLLEGQVPPEREPTEREQRARKLLAEYQLAQVNPVAADLEPELKKCMSRHRFGRAIHHPLLSQPEDNYTRSRNHEYNCLFKARTLLVEQAIEDGDWDRVLNLHERPWRLDAFYRYRANFTDEEYWTLLASQYIDSENIQNTGSWDELLSSDRSGREHMMNSEEQSYLASLPDSITIYRGCQKGWNQIGNSWALTEDKAKWFADRYYDIKNPFVIRRVVTKSEILAYKNVREEDEIILHPSAVCPS